MAEERNGHCDEWSKYFVTGKRQRLRQAYLTAAALCCCRTAVRSQQYVKLVFPGHQAQQRYRLGIASIDEHG